MYHQFKELGGLDITKEPMEVGPTTHYVMEAVSRLESLASMLLPLRRRTPISAVALTMYGASVRSRSDRSRLSIAGMGRFYPRRSSTLMPC